MNSRERCAFAPDVGRIDELPGCNPKASTEAIILYSLLIPKHDLLAYHHQIENSLTSI
ncbi:MAG: hypothetical protein ACNYWM_01640 [Methanosarcinales archaeon]